METHCYLCHSPSADEFNGRIAPAMVDIKTNYLKNFPNREEFVTNLVNFTAHPKLENSQMPLAVERYGLMPKQAFPEGSLPKIAAFMYNYLIEEPTWYKTTYENQTNQTWQQTGSVFEPRTADKIPEDIGLSYALETKKVLGKNLMGTIQNKGVSEALVFCNHQAYPLTDSMSVHFKASIKRVSDRNRNPQNKANAEELKYLQQFSEQLAQNKPIKPVVLQKANHTQFYYPIETNTLCLQCHGKKQDIKPEVQKEILRLYPQDLAVGYRENEVRGIWSIQFAK